MRSTYLTESTIPTWLGLSVILISLAIGLVTFNQKTSTSLQAVSEEYVPSHITLSNVSHTSFTVSWLSREPAEGEVIYGTSQDNLSSKSADDRDKLSGKVGKYHTHYVTIDNLQANTLYYFSVVTGGQASALYHGVTGPYFGVKQNEEVITGYLETSFYQPAVGAIVYLSTPGHTTLSSLVTESGQWVIPLSRLRSEDLSEPHKYHQKTRFTLSALSTPDHTMTATLDLTEYKPPLILTLGQTYTFLSGSPR